MEYKVTTMFQFKVIGFQKEFDYETAYQEIPKFWDEICEKYAAMAVCMDRNDCADKDNKHHFGIHCTKKVGGGSFSDK